MIAAAVAVVAVAGLTQVARATDGTWANPAANNSTAVAATAGSTSIAYGVAGQTFAVGDQVRMTGTTTATNPFGTAATNYYVVAVNGDGTVQLSTTFGGTALSAVNTITAGTALRNQSWQTATNWNSSTIANGVDAVASFTNSPVANVVALSLDGNVTVGKLSFTNTTNSSDMSLTSGTSSTNTLTFAVSGGVAGLSVPTIDIPTATNRLLNLGQTSVLKISGTQGLLIRSSAGGAVTGTGVSATSTTPTKDLRLTNVDWSDFSGGLIISRGQFSPQSAGKLPQQGLTVGDTSGTLAGLSMNTGRNQTVGGLNGNDYGRIYGGATLTVGSGDANGSFAGVIGRNFAGTADGTGLTKIGSGTQTISGVIAGSGAVTVSAGTLEYSGALISTTGNTTVNSGGTLRITGLNSQGTGANAGRIMVNAGGTLAGTGTIALSDTNAGLTGLSVSGVVSPGASIGTLTIDGTSSARSAAAFETGATFLMEVNSGLAADKVALVGGQANDIFFNNNVINFSDLSAGTLAGGDYVLFSSDVANAYSGLTLSGNTITGGLSIGTGLEAYASKSLMVDGNNIVLSVVIPEPATLAMLAVISGVALMGRRRRVA